MSSGSAAHPIRAYRVLRPGNSGIIQDLQEYNEIRSPEDRDRVRGCWGDPIGTPWLPGAERHLPDYPCLQLLHPCLQSRRPSLQLKGLLFEYGGRTLSPRARRAASPFQPFVGLPARNSRSSMTSSALEYISDHRSLSPIRNIWQDSESAGAHSGALGRRSGYRSPAWLSAHQTVSFMGGPIAVPWLSRRPP